MWTPIDNSKKPSMHSTTSSVNYTPESDSGKLDVNEAKRRLATIKQGTESVLKYFDKCFHLIEIVNGGPPEKNDSHLLASFMNGLNEKIRKAMQQDRLNDAFSARKLAIQEEMFISRSKPLDGSSEDRINKIEALQHFTWEKVRSYEKKLDYIQHEVHNFKKEFSDVKEMLKLILEQKTKEKVDPVDVIKAEANQKEVLQNIIQVKEILGEKLEKVEETTELSYEWIRQVHQDLRKVPPPPPPSTPPLPPPPPPPPPRSMPTMPKMPKMPPMPTIPTRIVVTSPIIPVTPIKRAASSMEEGPPGIKRLRKTEEYVINLLRPVLSDTEIQDMISDNITVHVERLYDAYRRRVEDIRSWMEQNRRPVTSDCSLCQGQTHHSYECPNVIHIDLRKKRLKSMNCCLECSKHHKGKCTANPMCGICKKARDEGHRLIIGGIQHCRMMCPLQEEFHIAFRICDELLKAKKHLEAA